MNGDTNITISVNVLFWGLLQETIVDIKDLHTQNITFIGYSIIILKLQQSYSHNNKNEHKQSNAY